MSTRGTLQLSCLTLSKNWVGRVTEVSDRPRRRHQLEQQLKAFSSYFGQHEVDAGDSSARPVELVNEANPNRVGGLHKNNWDRLGRGSGCKRTLVCSPVQQSRIPDGEPIRRPVWAADRFDLVPTGIRSPRSCPRCNRFRPGPGEKKRDFRALIRAT